MVFSPEFNLTIPLQPYTPAGAGVQGCDALQDQPSTYLIWHATAALHSDPNVESPSPWLQVEHIKCVKFLEMFTLWTPGSAFEGI